MFRTRRYNHDLQAGDGFGTGALLLVVLIALVSLTCK